MRKLILAAVCLSSLVGCSTPEERARMRAADEANEAANAAARYALVAKVQALPQSAKLECQMQGQQASAAASNPRALFDIVAGAYGIQAEDTCLRMKAAQVDEQRYVAAIPAPDAARPAKIRKAAYAARGPNEPPPLSDGRPWYCGLPDMNNTRIMVECQK